MQTIAVWTLTVLALIGLTGWWLFFMAVIVGEAKFVHPNQEKCRLAMNPLYLFHFQPALAVIIVSGFLLSLVCNLALLHML